MKFDNKELGVKFEIPDRPTVRQQLAYKAALASSDRDWFSRGWDGFLTIMQDWQCKAAPDVLALNLDTETDPAVTDIVLWTVGKVSQHMNELEHVPKNS